MPLSIYTGVLRARTHSIAVIVMTAFVNGTKRPVSSISRGPIIFIVL